MRFSSSSAFFSLCDSDKKKKFGERRIKKIPILLWIVRQWWWGRKSPQKKIRIITNKLTHLVSFERLRKQETKSGDNNNLSDSSMASKTIRTDEMKWKPSVVVERKQQKQQARVSLVFASSLFQRWLGKNIASFHWEMQKAFLLLLFSLQDLASPLCRISDKFCWEFALFSFKKLSSLSRNGGSKRKALRFVFEWINLLISTNIALHEWLIWNEGTNWERQFHQMLGKHLRTFAQPISNAINFHSPPYRCSQNFLEEKKKLFP